MTEKTKKPADDLTEVTVEVENHIHKGKPCKKGDKINVSAAAAEMLKKAWAPKEKE